jgi:hypothetical protein
MKTELDTRTHKLTLGSYIGAAEDQVREYPGKGAERHPAAIPLRSGLAMCQDQPLAAAALDRSTVIIGAVVTVPDRHHQAEETEALPTARR